MSVEKTAAEFGFTLDEIEELARVELEKTAAEKSEADRAHEWGKKGALINAGMGLGSTGAAVAHPGVRKALLKIHGGPKALAARVAVNTLGQGAVGYGAGRLVHRIAKGPASADRKAK